MAVNVAGQLHALVMDS